MTRLQASKLLALLLGALAGGVSCKDTSECLRHSDCPRERFCSDGSCVIKSTPDDGLGDAGGGGLFGSGGRASANGGASPSGARGGNPGNLGGSSSGAAGEAGAGGNDG